MFARHERVPGVTAVVGAAHLAHERRDRLAAFEVGAARVVHLADTLDSEDTRERHARRVALTCEELRAIEPECSHADAHPPGARFRAWYLFDLQHLGSARPMDAYGLHRCVSCVNPLPVPRPLGRYSTLRGQFPAASGSST